MNQIHSGVGLQVGNFRLTTQGNKTTYNQPCSIEFRLLFGRRKFEYTIVEGQKTFKIDVAFDSIKAV
eukprot:Pgem_evm1s13362